MNKLEYISAYRHFCRNGENVRISRFTLRKNIYREYGLDGYIFRCDNNSVEMCLTLDKKAAFRRFMDIVDFNLS